MCIDINRMTYSVCVRRYRALLVFYIWRWVKTKEEIYCVLSNIHTKFCITKMDTLSIGRRIRRVYSTILNRLERWVMHSKWRLSNKRNPFVYIDVDTLIERLRWAIVQTFTIYRLRCNRLRALLCVCGFGNFVQKSLVRSILNSS